MNSQARVIAFYLPQFQPNPINDKYWGKAFTEWTNVAKAKPLFSGHYQPQIPADLGFYDLRLPEIRKAQAEMAREAGVEGFCYWNYWFGRGKKILEMPIEETIRTHEPDYPFCIGWANHDWSNKTWKKAGRFQEDVVFLKQEYLGKDDYIAYFNYLLPMFLDKRYIRVDNKPLFYVFDPDNVPDTEVLIETFNNEAIKNRLKGIYFVCRADPIGNFGIKNEEDYLNVRAEKRYKSYMDKGYNAVNSFSFRRAEVISNGIMNRAFRKIQAKVTGASMMDYDYSKLIENLYMPEDEWENVFPTVCPRKDRTPRSGKNAWLYRDSTPELFQRNVELCLDRIKKKSADKRIVFLDSWNEWGEGAYMEPDLKFGHGYLEALKKALNK